MNLVVFAVKKEHSGNLPGKGARNDRVETALKQVHIEPFVPSMGETTRYDAQDVVFVRNLGE